MKIFQKFLFLLFSLTPAYALAQSFNLESSDIGNIIGQILNIIAILIPILFALAFIVFFWGLSKFILHSDSAAEVKTGKTYMFWGIIALFVLVSARAIISFISSDLELGNSTSVPLLPTNGGDVRPNVSTGSTVVLPDGSVIPAN